MLNPRIFEPRHTIVCLAFGTVVTLCHAAMYTVHLTEDIDDGICGPDGSFGGGVCTLREAIKSANASLEPDTIRLFGNTFLLTLAGADQSALVGDLDIRSSDLTIRGAGAGNTIVDGSGIGADNIFDIDTFAEGITVVMEDLTIEDAGTDGILNRRFGNLTLNRCVVAGCSTAGIRNLGALQINHSTIEGNTFTGIKNFSTGNATITDSIIRDNSATLGGHGGGMVNEGSNITINLIRTQVLNNTACRCGGGIYNIGSTLNIIDSTLSGTR